MTRMILLTTTLLLSTAPMALAQFAVIDASNIVQTTITATNSITQVAQQAAAYVRQAQQLYAQYQSIHYQRVFK